MWFSQILFDAHLSDVGVKDITVDRRRDDVQVWDQVQNMMYNTVYVCFGHVC